jgi:adenylate kinase family enzyme
LRVALAGNIDRGFAIRLSKTLGLPLFFPTEEKACQSGLPSDDAVIASIVDIIDQQSGVDKANGYVLAGYPLNIVQAQSLDIALARSGQAIDTVLMLKTTEPLKQKENKPLRRYYRSQNKLILLSESSTIDEICSSIAQIHKKRRVQR